MSRDDEERGLLDPNGLAIETDDFYGTTAIPAPVVHRTSEEEQLLNPDTLIHDTEVSHPGSKAVMSTIDLDLLEGI